MNIRIDAEFALWEKAKRKKEKCFENEEEQRGRKKKILNLPSTVDSVAWLVGDPNITLSS